MESYINITRNLWDRRLCYEFLICSRNGNGGGVGYLGNSNLAALAKKIIEISEEYAPAEVVLKSESERNLFSEWSLPRDSLESLLALLNKSDSGVAFSLTPNPSNRFQQLIDFSHA